MPQDLCTWARSRAVDQVQDRLALDRASVRSIDADGHLHVGESNISRSQVAGYWGREIPDYESLGLQPDKLYQLLRDPAELEKAAASFNGKPLLITHKPQTAADHDHELTVGAVSNVRYEAPYLKAELAVWDAAAIAGITTGGQKELSAAYRYVPVMQAGTYQGVRYDGRMTQIQANHVALVESGRAGSDVVVGDSQPKELAPMPKPLSRTALLTSGALRAYLLPKLAQDMKIDLHPVLAKVTARTWKAERPRLRLALDAALAGKLAKDASLSDVDDLLDELQEAINDVADDPEPDPAEDEEAETEEEKKARMARRAADKAAKDAEPSTFTKKDDDKKDDDKKGKPAMDHAITKPAMDAAISAAVSRARAETETATIARMRAIQEAERAVRPFIGEVVIAQDSAESVYRLALDANGIDLTGVPAAAYAAMVRMLPRPGTSPTPRVAMDAAAGEEAKFRARYPTAVKLIRS